MIFTPKGDHDKNTTDNNAVINEQWEYSPREYISELSSITEEMAWKKYWKDCNSQNTRTGYSIQNTICCKIVYHKKLLHKQYCNNNSSTRLANV